MTEVYRTVVDGATVSAHLADADWLIVDTRHQLADPGAGERAYDAGHLPGAIFLHLDRDLSGPMTGRNGRHPLPAVDDLAALFGRIGIAESTQVVVYDDAGGMIAGRLWWLLRWMGHDRVALLDGGFQAWQDAGFPVVGEQSDAGERAPTRFFPQVRASMLATIDEVVGNLSRAEALLVDARSADRFRGENETLDPVGGHIPGACNRFFRDNLTPEGFLKPAATLRQEYLALCGTRSAAQIVHQCGSGVSACLSVLAMEHAGLSGSRLYAGSWSEWCSDHADARPRPIARGVA